MRVLTDRDNLSNSQRSYLNLALNIARENTSRHKHGAVLVKGGSIIALGASRSKNNFPFTDKEFNELRGKFNDHAEDVALRQVNYDATGMVLYVARAHRGTNDPMYSKPCPYCQGLIAASNVKTVIYTTTPNHVRRAKGFTDVATH